jgi:2-aminoethylphosphonate-pyruvate transaminase
VFLMMLFSAWFSRSPRTILLCPGPVLLSKRVRQAVAQADICHREVEFSNLLRSSTEHLKPVVGLPRDDQSYEIAFLTGSGTAANEAVLSSIGAQGPVLIISNGEFGERLYEVAKLHNPEVDLLAFRWQESVDLEAVTRTLAGRRYHLVAMVHHETSTGLLNPVAEVAKLAHQNGALMSVDAISSIGAEDIRLSDWGVDILVGTSGKALSAMPGIGILIVKSDVLSKLTGATHGHYLDLRKHFHYMRELTQTPNTPAVHVMASLHAALTELTSRGVESSRAIVAERAAYTRRQIREFGLTFADFGTNTSNVITCVNLPDFLTFDHLAQEFKKHGIVIYNGKGVLKDRVFQIGHIGALRRSDTIRALRLLRKIIHDAQVLQHHHGSQQQEKPAHVH